MPKKPEKINLYDYHSFAEIEHVAGSCGVYELFNLSSGPVDCVVRAYLEPAPLFMFSDAVKKKHGRRLAAYIKRYGLGTVVAGPVVVNVNDPARNKIQAWVWRPKVSALNRWAEKHTYEAPVERESRYV